jgi:hypothetical protein
MTQQVEELGFTCGACGKQFRWKPELAGRSVKCKCETVIRVPAAAGGVAQPKSAAAPAVEPPASAPSGSRGAAAASATSPVRPRTVAPTRKAAPPPLPPPPPAPEDDPFAALNALAQEEAGAADGAADMDEAIRCPNCRGFLAPEAVLCTSCGFDRRKGKVLASAKAAPANAGPKRGLFGFGKPKPETAGKKEVVDKMAPQGSFIVGIFASVALASLASVAWLGVAWAFERDVFYLVLLIGGAAGLGMQLGQKGYSTLGGFAAAVVALAVIIGARVALVIVVLLPLLRMASGVDSGEDPRVVMSLMAAEYEARGLDSKEATVEEYEEVGRTAERKASTLTPEQKQQIIAQADAAMAAEPEPEPDDETGGSGLFMAVVFGGIKSFLFMLGALFLAFRTASGSVSG